MGGLLFDIQNTHSTEALTITGFSWLTPAAYGRSGDHFPLVLMYRRKNPAQCDVGRVCTGSVRDNMFNLDGIYGAGGGDQVCPLSSKGPVPACAGNNTAIWTRLISHDRLVGLAQIVRAPSTLSLVLQSGETVGLWAYFSDGTKILRSKDSTAKEIGGTTPVAGFNTPAEGPTFAYTTDQTLRISAAMQADDLVTPQWTNARPFTGSLHYVRCPGVLPPSTTDDEEGGNGGAIAAGILVPLFVIGGGGFLYMRHKQQKQRGSRLAPLDDFEEDAPMMGAKPTAYVPPGLA